jgi:hypothetical protein
MLFRKYNPSVFQISIQQRTYALGCSENCIAVGPKYKLGTCEEEKILLGYCG